MPGFILHLAESKLIIEELNQKGFYPDDRWINAFQLGCVLPDTKMRGHKEGSHFWNPVEMDNLAIGPDLDRFLAAYGNQIQGPIMLGYFAHLHLDNGIIRKFWKEQFEIRDADGNQVVLRKDAVNIYIKSSKQVVPRDEFLSDKYYYGDYSRMNNWVIDHYQISIPWYDNELNCPIQEVTLEDVKKILEELERLKDNCVAGAEKELKVFDLELFVDFVKNSAAEISEIIAEYMRCE